MSAGANELKEGVGSVIVWLAYPLESTRSSNERLAGHLGPIGSYVARPWSDEMYNGDSRTQGDERSIMRKDFKFVEERQVFLLKVMR
jgi:hypothetical protein